MGKRKKIFDSELTEHFQSHIGWIQLEIITMLWNREMYGLEIKSHLKLRGKDISPGQLYPTLKKLETMKALESYEDKSTIPSRIFYRCTEEGKNMVRKHIRNVIMLLQGIIVEKIDYIPSKIMEQMPFSSNWRILDFSPYEFDDFLVNFAAPIGPLGRYFLYNRDINYKPLLVERIAHNNLKDKILLLDSKEQIQNFPEHQIDCCICSFVLHEENSEWIIGQIERLLSPNGKMIIIDFVANENYFFSSILAEFVGEHHDLIGINVSHYRSHFESIGFSVEHEFEEKGIYVGIYSYSHHGRAKK